MARPNPIPLREADYAPAPRAEVIDVRFKIVRGRGRWLASFGRWALAFLAAALIGFLAPPVWVALQHIAATLGA